MSQIRSSGNNSAASGELSSIRASVTSHVHRSPLTQTETKTRVPPLLSEEIRTSSRASLLALFISRREERRFIHQHFQFLQPSREAGAGQGCPVAPPVEPWTGCSRAMAPFLTEKQVQTWGSASSCLLSLLVALRGAQACCCRRVDITTRSARAGSARSPGPPFPSPPPCRLFGGAQQPGTAPGRVL